jgi:hypothetical protein
MFNRKIVAAGLLVVAVVAAACSSSKGSNKKSGGTALVGTFKLTAGACKAGKATGSYFRMIQSGGSVAKGPFFPNPDSTCKDKTYTTLRPGSDGGLVTGSYQPNPSPAFDKKGNGLAARITKPQAFSAIDFALSTNQTDPSSKKSVSAPSITDNNGTLSGDLRALSAQWNKLYINQGSPKPDGSTPGLTTAVTGTYNASTKAFVITWSTSIVGGAFNGFTGYWHLQGTFSPSK